MQYYNLTVNHLEFYNGTSWVSTDSGGGDVVGPISSTDNAIVRFSGTGGKNIQNSGVIIDDLDNVSGMTSLSFDDGETLNIGAGSDLSIVHDGANTILTSTTGNLIVDNTNTTGQTIFTLGSIDSFTNFTVRDNALANIFSVFGSGIVKLLDNRTLALGTGNDLLIVHDGSNSSITNTTGNLVIDNQGIIGSVLVDLGTDTSTTTFGVSNNSGSVLFEVFGDGLVNIPDNGTFSLGTGSDLTIIHDGTNTTLTSTTGNLIIDNVNTTGSTIFTLGTDTAATHLIIRDNSENNIVDFRGSGVAVFSDSREVALGNS